MKAAKRSGWSTDDKLVTSQQEKAEHFDRQCSTSPPLVFPPYPDLQKSTSNPEFQFSIIVFSEHRFAAQVSVWKECWTGNITSKRLKLSAPAISESLTAIFGDPLSLGTFPPIMKRVDCAACAESWKRCHEACAMSFNIPPSNVPKLKVVEKVFHGQLIHHCLGNSIILDQHAQFLPF